MAVTLEIRILGPLEVWSGGTPMPLGGTNQRAVLAALALHPGVSVPSDALIDAIWGETPPSSVRTMLQGCISRIRKLLTEAGGDPSILETAGGGYVLHADPQTLDALGFHDLAERGREALSDGRTQEGRDLLGRALALWRGPAAAGLDLSGDIAEGIAALEEAHLAARLTVIEADLLLGHHGEVTAELEAMRTDDPLDERVAALSMVSLYRSGRQAEALEVAGKLRRALSEGLGIEPSTQILSLEHQILVHDPELDEGAAPITAVTPLRRGRKPVTALVCRLAPAEGTKDPEIRAIGMQADTERVVEALSHHGAAIELAVAGHIVGVFGIPAVHEDDASRAVRAAAAVRALGEADVLQVRVGVATGDVLVQELDGVQTLLSADPIEHAERLVQAAKPGEVLLSDTAFRLARDAAGAEPAQVLLLDDQGPAGTAFRLLQVDPDATGRRLRSPLVGREAELDVLRQTLSRSQREAQTQLVTVLGQAGVGKSRLAAELTRFLPAGGTVLTGRCLSYGSDITYWPIAEIVRQAAGIQPDDPADVARDRIEAVLVGDDEVEFLTAQLEGILGLADGAVTPEEIPWTIRRFLEAVAGPLVVVVDDIHWAESTLLDLIEQLANWQSPAAIVLVCLARPDLLEHRASWGSGRAASILLTLGPLGRAGSERLIANLLEGAGLDDQARERILMAAEGHPLYLEELLTSLIDDGAIRREDDRWVATHALIEVGIPPTIQALLGARLDRLSPAQRQVAERAAIVGKEFSEQDVHDLSLEDPQLTSVHLSATLDALAATDLIVPQGLGTGPRRAFSFRHQLVRDVAYDSTAKETRARDHARLAAALAARFGERIGEVEEIVGYHLESAHRYLLELGRTADAAPLARNGGTHLAAAGKRSYARYDMRAAVNLIGRALDLLDPGDPSVPDLRRHRGVAFYDMGEFEPAERELARGLDQAEEAGDTATAFLIKLDLADVRMWHRPGVDDSDTIQALIASAIDRFESDDDQAGIARAYRLKGDLLGLQGQMGRATEAYALGRTYASLTEDPREMREVLSLGVAHGPTPVEEGIARIRATIEQTRSPAPDALLSLGFLAALSGRSDESDGYFAEALDRSEERGLGFRAASARMHMGTALLYEGRVKEARSALARAAEDLGKMGEGGMLSTTAALLGEANYQLGHLDEAIENTDTAEHAAAPEDAVSQAVLRGVRAKVLASRGDLEAALILAREAVAVADATDLLSTVGDAHRDLAVVLEAAGRSEEAAAELAIALDRYLTKGNLAAAERLGELTPLGDPLSRPG